MNREQDHLQSLGRKVEIPDTYAPQVLEAFEEKGWVEREDDRWHFTVPGYLISNTLIGILLEAQAAGRVESIPWVDRAGTAERKLSMPKGEDELFAELYEQTKTEQ